MTPERWAEVNDVLQRAMQLAPDRRADYLDHACAADSALRREVESLLAADQQARSSFLQSAPLGLTKGTRLGDYEVLSKLGAGGMGEVYRALDVRLRREVAIKILPGFASSDPERLRRFEQEAMAAAALNHPNILAVFQMGTHQGAPYLVSELLEGETLRELIKRGRIALRKAIDYAVQIAHGLAAAHEKGIVHRDLKPENLFVTKDGRVKILDFGLAKLTQPRSSSAHTALTVGSETEPGMVMGTVGYMSPEQVRAQTTDHRTDIFAFGAILYEMLTGQRAFQKPTSAETMAAILNEEPPPISQINLQIPPGLQRVVGRCLEKNPEQRFQSASDLAFALEALSDSGPLSATALPTPRPQRKLYVGIAAAGVVAAALITAAYFYLHRPPKLTEKDTIVLADFSNSTGDPIFSETLKDALGVSLRQSPFLDIASDEKVVSTLRLMTKPADTALIPQVAREVCQRTQSKAYISGSIASLDTQYVIGLKAVDCANGDLLAHEQITAAGKEKVLEALGNAASKLRNELGESISSVQKSDVPLELLTTSSLEAFKAFTQGAKAQLEGKGAAVSLTYFLRAIELDPDFAHAYSSAGVMYYSLGDYPRSKEYVTKAYALRNRVSPYENLLMQADYNYYVLGDEDKSLALYEQMAEGYPRQDVPWSYLSIIYADLGQLEKALQADLQVVRLEADGVYFYPRLIDHQRSLGRLSEAHQSYDLAIARQPDDPALRAQRYLLAFVEGDAKGMAQQTAWFEKRPPETQIRMLLLKARTAAYVGHMHEAQESTGRASAAAIQARNTTMAAFATLDAARREAAVGNLRAANAQANAALNLAPENENAESSAAEIFARAGDAPRALKLASDLTKRFSRNTIIQRYWLPKVRAHLARVAGKPAEAVEQLRVEESMEARSCNYSYDRGEAYLEAGQGSAAAAAFQQILDHPGLVGNCLSGALAHLQIGRAYAITQDTAKAKVAYENFLTLWKDADPDVPILKQAKAEYTRLQ